MHIYRNTGALSRNDCRRRRTAKNIRLCVCVCVCVGGGVPGWLGACMRVALLSQHTTRMRHVVTSFVPPLAPPHFLTLSHNRTIFGKKSLNINCVFWLSLQLLFQTFLVLRINERHIVINIKTSSCKTPFIFVELQRKLHFLDRFSEKSLKYKISPKSFQWKPSCSMRTDGRTWWS